MSKQYVSRARQEGFGGRATQNSYTGQPRRSTYDGALKTSSFKPHNPFESGVGSGRHHSPEDACYLYPDGDHRKDVKAHVPREGDPRPHLTNAQAVKQRDERLSRTAELTWAPGHREAVMGKK